MLIKLAVKSLLSRKVTVGLTLVSIAISVFVLLSIQFTKTAAKSGFTNTVSGTDLIVGARTGDLNLLLYSVFRVGNATNNISWKSFDELSQAREVAWAIPISLGDSHMGFRVVGTNQDYFLHYQYGNKQALQFEQGAAFEKVYDLVLGSDVAKSLKYSLGDVINISHGIGSAAISEHKDGFEVVGILEPTGTPVDQSVHVRLEGLEAVHVGWQAGIDLSRFQTADISDESKLKPKSITAFMVGLNSKLSTFTFQRKVNQYKKEPLSAILPGVALSELWRILGRVELILVSISWLVLIAALIGMSTMMLAAMQQRKPEFATLRAVGAHPRFIVFLVQMEAMLTVIGGIMLGTFCVVLASLLFQSSLNQSLGVSMSGLVFSVNSLLVYLPILLVTPIVALLPAISAYRTS
jgi:putative ABC transport system permease protein